MNRSPQFLAALELEKVRANLKQILPGLDLYEDSNGNTVLPVYQHPNPEPVSWISYLIYPQPDGKHYSFGFEPMSGPTLEVLKDAIRKFKEHLIYPA